MRVYVVVKMYGGGYECTKGSFDMDEMFDTINNGLIVKIFSDKSSAFIYAYELSVCRYVELCHLYDVPQLYHYPTLVQKGSCTIAIQEKLETLHENMHELNIHGELYYSYRVVEYDVTDIK